MLETIRQKCTNCKKMGMIRCDGCIERFCWKHFGEHRYRLDNLFEQICNDRDRLCEQIQNPCSASLNHPQLITLVDQINEWEKTTLKTVKQTASHIREQINELMKSSNKPIKAELDELSKELSKRKEEDDYFEQDIERLSKRLEQIQIDLKTRLFPAIRINLTTIDWSTIIQVASETSKHNVIHQQQSRLFVGGTLLSKIHQVQLNRLYGNENQTWELIYKATKNGFDTKICHRCCDKRGSTITVIQSSEGYLFGGYTTVSSDAKKNVWMNDKTAFLFTLTNPYNIPPTKYPINSKGENAILSSFRTGPIFGHFDICIYLQKNRYGDSFSEFPTDYIDLTGKGNLTFTGSETFSIADIEIYYLDSKNEEQLTI